MKMCQNINLQKLILTYRPIWSRYQVDIEIYPGKLDQSGDRILFSHIMNNIIIQISEIYLRNKFHFSGGHGSMNAMGHVQSKWGVTLTLYGAHCVHTCTGVTLTLHGTHCVHTSMALRKMKFICYIYDILGIISISQSQLKAKELNIIMDLEV